MNKAINYILVALVIVNTVLASSTVTELKMGVGNKPLNLILVTLYVIIAVLVLTYLIFKEK